MSEQPTAGQTTQQVPTAEVVEAQQDTVDELVAVISTQQAVLARQDQQIEALTSALEAALDGRVAEAAEVLATVRAPRQEGA